MTELKPCPFCGSKHILVDKDLPGAHCVECQDCYATISCYPTKQNAIDAWNRRRNPMMKLKPCPFCGGEAEVKSFREDMIFAQCKECLTTTNKYLSPERAVNAWNTRYTLCSKVKHYVLDWLSRRPKHD
jgi:Lar family restriction alleviation protein